MVRRCKPWRIDRGSERLDVCGAVAQCERRLSMRPSTGRCVGSIGPRKGAVSSGRPGASGDLLPGFPWGKPREGGRHIRILVWWKWQLRHWRVSWWLPEVGQHWRWACQAWHRRRIGRQAWLCCKLLFIGGGYRWWLQMGLLSTNFLFEEGGQCEAGLHGRCRHNTSGSTRFWCCFCRIRKMRLGGRGCPRYFCQSRDNKMHVLLIRGGGICRGILWSPGLWNRQCNYQHQRVWVLLVRLWGGVRN